MGGGGGGQEERERDWAERQTDRQRQTDRDGDREREQISVTVSNYMNGRYAIPPSHDDCHNTDVTSRWRRAIGRKIYWKCNRVYCVCVPGHDLLIFCFLSSFPFWLAGMFWPQLSKMLKLVRYSNLWLVTLHPCFQPASLTSHPAPLQNLALRSGLEVEESHTDRETV